MKSSTSEEMLALYALGVPVAALCREFGATEERVRGLARYWKVRRPSHSDRKLLARANRVERIRRNIEAYPGSSLFSTLEAAA